MDDPYWLVFTTNLSSQIFWTLLVQAISLFMLPFWGGLLEVFLRFKPILRFALNNLASRLKSPRIRRRRVSMVLHSLAAPDLCCPRLAHSANTCVAAYLPCLRAGLENCKFVKFESHLNIQKIFFEPYLQDLFQETFVKQYFTLCSHAVMQS